MHISSQGLRTAASSLPGHMNAPCWVLVRGTWSLISLPMYLQGSMFSLR